MFEVKFKHLHIASKLHVILMSRRIIRMNYQKCYNSDTIMVGLSSYQKVLFVVFFLSFKVWQNKINFDHLWFKRIPVAKLRFWQGCVQYKHSEDALLRFDYHFVVTLANKIFVKGMKRWYWRNKDTRWYRLVKYLIYYSIKSKMSPMRKKLENN